MSLLLILRKIWNYKLVTLPIVALVLAGSFYVMAVEPPTYQSSATYILIPPPSPPTATSGSPTNNRTNNPYSRLSDPSVLVQVLASQLNSDEFRRGLATRGVASTYTAQPSAAFGFSAPIMQITGTGTTATAAVTTTTAVGRALTQTLDQMQQARGVDKAYWITTEAVVPAADATLKPSGKLRSLVAVLVLGTILLFIAISILDAVSAMRSDRAEEHSAEDSTGPAPTPPLVPNGPSAGWDRPLSALDPDPIPWTSEVNR